MPGQTNRRTTKKRNKTKRSHSCRRTNSPPHSKTMINPVERNRINRNIRLALEQEQARRLLQEQKQLEWQVAHPDLHERNILLRELALHMARDRADTAPGEALSFNYLIECPDTMDLLFGDDSNVATIISYTCMNGSDLSVEDMEMIDSWIAHRINYPPH